MNVRDFLLNFVDRDTKICVLRIASGQILFYGNAKTLDHIEVLNKMVEYVDYDIEEGCLIIKVSGRPTGAILHLPEDLDFAYERIGGICRCQE